MLLVTRQAAKLFPQGLAIDTEDFRRTRFVAIDGLEHAPDVFIFQRSQRAAGCAG